jgi:hypothetical protein
VSEPLPEPRHPGRTVAVTEPDLALQRKNVRFGFALLGLSLLIAIGTVLIAFAYLQFD